MRGVLNDAVSIYFADATLASAFAARWCVASRVEANGACFKSVRMSPHRGPEHAAQHTIMSRAGSRLQGHQLLGIGSDGQAGAVQ